MKCFLKFNIITLLLLIPMVACVSQTRVTESSSRRAPDWVNGLERDFVITVGTGSTIQEAQRDALNMVREDIVNAVAVHVQTETEMYTEETNLNNHVNSFMQTFATSTSTAAGPVPYLQGITLSQVEDYYWEKVENRRDGTVNYNYHIKYPFSDFELQSLVMDFRKRDREMTEDLESILRSVDKQDFSTVEEIDKKIDELRVMSDYFVDARKDRAQLGIARCRRLYESIELVETESRLGELTYALRLGDNVIHTSRRPHVNSECARITNIDSHQGYTTVDYDYDYCYEDPENHIQVRYRFGTVTVQRPFYFDIAEEKVSFFVNDPFHFEALAKDENVINEAKLGITIVSQYESPFTIEKIVLEWPNHAPVILDNLGQYFAGKGNHSLELFINQPLIEEITSSAEKRVAMLSGYIEYKSDITGEKRTYQIFNQRYSTNW